MPEIVIKDDLRSNPLYDGPTGDDVVGPRDVLPWWFYWGMFFPLAGW